MEAYIYYENIIDDLEYKKSLSAMKRDEFRSTISKIIEESYIATRLNEVEWLN